jgi:hypothetical protein
VISGTARTIAEALVLSAGAAAAYVVITTPPLRQLALRVARVWLGASVPVYLAKEVHSAWAESQPAA